MLRRKKIIIRRKLLSPSKHKTQMSLKNNSQSMNEKDMHLPRKRIKKIIRHKTLLINNNTTKSVYNEISNITTTTPYSLIENEQIDQELPSIMSPKTYDAAITTTTNENIVDQPVTERDIETELRYRDKNMQNMQNMQNDISTTANKQTSLETTTLKSTTKTKKPKRKRRRQMRKQRNKQNRTMLQNLNSSPTRQQTLVEPSTSTTLLTVTSLTELIRTRTYTLVVDRVSGTDHEIQATSTFERVQTITSPVAHVITQTLLLLNTDTKLV